jgi:Mrp family chromosome partitioning ATPase
VILDLPPVNAVIDAAVVAKLTDGLLLVIRENHCPKFVLEDCMEQLKYAKANILGFVMNGSANGAGKRYKYGKAYRYGDGYYQYGHYGK